MQHIPETLDWVKARSSCSLDAVFGVLREGIDSDIESINGLNRRSLKFYRNTEAPEKKLIVIGERDVGGLSIQMSVVFELKEDRIVVSKRKGNTFAPESSFEGIPSLNEKGECLLRVDDEYFRQWQFRQKGLEELFFGF